MSGELEKLLESVARDIGTKNVAELTMPHISEILKRRLLPLLEAGQALASPYADGIDELIADYRAAKQKALDP